MKPLNNSNYCFVSRTTITWPSKTTIHSIDSKHLTSGRVTVLSRRTPTTPFISVNAQCRTRHVLSSLITKRKTWRSCRKCSVVNGNLFSCRQKVSISIRVHWTVRRDLTLSFLIPAQSKVDKKRDKLERKVLDSQERAFWDVFRPMPNCINTTEVDIKKAYRKGGSSLGSGSGSTRIHHNYSVEQLTRHVSIFCLFSDNALVLMFFSY